MESERKAALSKRVLHFQNVFEERALSILNRQRGSDQTLDRRFRSTFGVSSHVCCRVWQLLQRNMNDLMKMTPDHLLWGLLLLKVYSVEVPNSSLVGVDEKTFRKWSHFAIVRVADMCSEVVRLFFYQSF